MTTGAEPSPGSVTDAGTQQDRKLTLQSGLERPHEELA